MYSNKWSETIYYRVLLNVLIVFLIPVFLTVSDDPPPPYTPPESNLRGSHHRHSTQASGIPQSSSGQKLAQATTGFHTPPVRPVQHRHSMPSDARPQSGGSSGSSRPRSRSDNNMCQLNTSPKCSDMHFSQSSQSLPNGGTAYTNQSIVRENSGNSLSSQGVSTSAQVGLSADSLSLSQEGIQQSKVNQSIAETFTHTNVVQIRQVVDMPPLQRTCSKTSEDLGPEYSTTCPERMATEHSISEDSVGDNFQFADEDEQVLTQVVIFI